MNRFYSGILSKKMLGMILGLMLVLGSLAPGHAALFDRGSFDGVNLIYDDDLNITWLGDANYAQTSGFDIDGLMNWQTATGWASGLNVGGFTNWRLPNVSQPDPTCSIPNIGGNIGQAGGLNCTGSEMGHLFHDELSGTALSNILNSGDSDLSLFSNVQTSLAFSYWAGTEFVGAVSGNIWGFDFQNGSQIVNHMSTSHYAWAVRDGDVTNNTDPIPEPSTVLLFGTGLAGLIGWRYRRQSQK